MSRSALIHRHRPFSFSRFGNILPVLAVMFLASSLSVAYGQDEKKAPTPTPNQETQEQDASKQESKTSTPVVNQPSANTEAILASGDIPTTIQELREMEQHFAELAKASKPAVVNIRIGGAQGSGVVVTDDGYILTAAHVIGGPNKTAIVTFPDGKKVKATTLGVERGIDSGMLKINDDEGEDWPYANIGISEDLAPGQWVMAIGHPGGLDTKRGLVVRVGRIIFRNSRVLRTDCTLVGGDSGGPLFDMHGDVIGIHSRIGDRLWNNLHVPIDTFSDNWDELEDGLVIDGRASLGFSVVGNTNEITSVTDDGPAKKAGVLPGDVVLKIGSQPIANKDDIGKAVLQLKPFMKIKMVVLRDGEKLTLHLLVGSR